MFAAQLVLSRHFCVWYVESHMANHTRINCILPRPRLTFRFRTALSPLLVKVWRMYKLHRASAGFRRTTITHSQTALMMLPVILTELTILSVFNSVDPPRLHEWLELGEGYATQYLECKRQSDAFEGVQTGFHGKLSDMRFSP